MLRNTKAQMIAVLAVGGLLGYTASSSRLDLFHSAKAEPSRQSAKEKTADITPHPSASTLVAAIKPAPKEGTCCAAGSAKSRLVALANVDAKLASLQADGKKPNILFIMGDDIGWMQPSIYHRGLMVGETPNIDRIGNDGAIFMDYVAMQSCTSGRNAFFTGMYPLRTGMIPPQRHGISDET